MTKREHGITFNGKTYHQGDVIEWEVDGVGDLSDRPGHRCDGGCRHVVGEERGVAEVLDHDRIEPDLGQGSGVGQRPFDDRIEVTVEARGARECSQVDHPDEGGDAHR